MKDIQIKNHQNIIRTVSIILFIVVMLALTVMLLPFFLSLSDTGKMAEFKGYIMSLGVWGVIFLIGIQALQIVVALIPGEVVEFVAGVLFGTLGGLLICLAGSLIGTIIVFFAVRKFGYPLVSAFFNQDKLSKYKFLHDEKKLEYLTFIFFIIPGTPKDVFTYFAGLTNINPTSFIIIATFARIPSIITSTYAGSALENGDVLKTVVIYVVTALIGGIGIIINKYIEDKRSKRSHKEDTKSDVQGTEKE